MARFKIGQKIVCVVTRKTPIIARNEFGRAIGNPVSYYPKYGEIVTVAGYSMYHKNSIELFEYYEVPPGWSLPYCYPEDRFEPLMDITELTEILEHQTQEL